MIAYTSISMTNSKTVEFESLSSNPNPNALLYAIRFVKLAKAAESK